MAGAGFAAAPSRVKNGAWWTFASSLSVMLVSGTVYGFGEWSSTLKDPKGYALDQKQLEWLSAIANFGTYMVLDSGLLVSRFGTVVTLAVGCAYACAGYFLLWLSIAQFPGEVPFAVLAFFCMLYGHGCGTIDNAVMTELLSDFPEHKGSVVGCVKAYYGLAVATVGTIYQAAFAPTETSFLLFLAVYSGVAGLLLVPVLQVTRGLVEGSRTVVGRRFGAMAAGMVVAIVFFFIVQVNAERLSRPAWIGVLVTVAIGLTLPFLLAVVPSGSGSREMSAKPQPQKTAAASCSGSPVDVSGCGMLGRLDFYALLLVLIVGQGSGLLFINNSAQILPALQGQAAAARVPAFVAVISIFNAFGRLSFGNLSEYLRGSVHRTWFLVASLGILFLSYLALRLAGGLLAWPAAASVGFGYGGLWGVQPALVSELFGPRDYGFKYACSALAAFLGSLLFSTLLAGSLYDREAAALRQAPGCYASSCFNTAFFVTGVCGVPALLLAIALCRRTAWVYEQLARSEGGVAARSPDEENAGGSCGPSEASSYEPSEASEAVRG
mmetsp:Transcript_64971/g.196044  ORF Transcript_64971/g.196044 Transcript_64971/m.196044 type:complete len:551 (-) Transcript_64971:547-2199(-)